MKIGVLSDTHMREMDPELEKALAAVFADVDMIIHAGDITNLQVLESLDSPNVVAVAGNMDDHLTASQLPVKRVLRLEGRTIGVIHGYGAPNGLEDRIRNEFEEVDAIIYGHSHQPANHVRAGVLFFNPGSVSRGYRGSGTVGILEVGREIKGEIISL